MKEPVVVAHTDDRTVVGVADSDSGWKYLFLLGTGIAVIGFIEIALLFIPAQFASLDWEFGTVNGFFDSLPLLTIGLGVMSAAAVANGWLVTRRLMVVVTLLMALVVLIMGTVLALDIPAVLNATPEAVLRHQVKMVSLKAGLMGVTYFVLYLALGVWTWRRLKAIKGAKA